MIINIGFQKLSISTFAKIAKYPLYGSRSYVLLSLEAFMFFENNSNFMIKILHI